MEKIKSYPNTQLPDFTPTFAQIPGLNAEALDYRLLKNRP